MDIPGKNALGDRQLREKMWEGFPNPDASSCVPMRQVVAIRSTAPSMWRREFF